MANQYPPTPWFTAQINRAHGSVYSTASLQHSICMMQQTVWAIRSVQHNLRLHPLHQHHRACCALQSAQHPRCQAGSAAASHHCLLAALLLVLRAAHCCYNICGRCQLPSDVVSRGAKCVQRSKSASVPILLVSTNTSASRAWPSSTRYSLQWQQHSRNKYEGQRALGTGKPVGL